jgi:hypothetical protein
MNTSTSTVPYAISLTVTGTSGGLSHTASTTLVVNLATPSALDATTSSNLVNLSWGAVPGATGYRIGRSLSGVGFRTIACPVGPAYSDTGVQNGVTYHYAVTAVYSGGASDGGATSESAEILATPPCPLPGYSGTLTAGKDGAGTPVWSWTQGGATAFDLVRGDLPALRGSGGDFGAALDALPAGEAACLANDTTSLALTDPTGAPPPEGAEFTLLRAVSTVCPAQGTLDEGVPGQVGSRDAEVSASSRACP